MKTIKVAKITFSEGGREYYFDCNDLKLHDGLNVVVETERGLQFGNISEIVEVDANKYKNLKEVVRIASKKDFEQYQRNIKDSRKAFDKCKELIENLKLDMKLICSKFLYSFNNITINMAKNQNLSLNPTKINGSCNRLLCCLDYEDDTYSEEKKKYPKIGTIVNRDGKKGKVISIDIFRKSYRVETEDKDVIEIFLDESNK